MMNILPKSIKICAVLVLLFNCAFAQDPNFHIYLAFGQSNMEGQGTIENQDKTVDSRFQVMGALTCSGTRSLSQGKWAPATPPLFRCDTKLSPADYFGRTMVAKLPASIKVGIVPVAVAGCKIELFDKANYASYANSAESWMKNIINAYGGNPYGRLVDIAKTAQKDGVIKGILFHQGESNSGQADWPNKVKAVYDNLIKDLGLDPKKVPLLVGEVVTTEMKGQCGGHNSVIAKVPGVIPNSYVISASGLAPVSDNLHFSSASYRTLGERYATKMLSLLAVTGVEGQSEMQEVAAFPNPFNNELNITREGSFSYQVMDAIGQLVESGNGEGEVKIGKNLNEGVYMVKISQENTYKVFKVVKE